jgi:hypothetical protein
VVAVAVDYFFSVGSIVAIYLCAFVGEEVCICHDCYIESAKEPRMRCTNIAGNKASAETFLSNDLRKSVGARCQCQARI